MDVTDAKLFQLENQRLTARLATTLETVSDSMFTLDEQWRFTYLNRAAEDQFRHSRESLLGKVFWEALPDAIGTISEESYREAKGSQQNVEFERYSPQLDKWVHCRVYPHNEGVAVYFQDITEAKRAEQELRQHALRLQALSRRLFQVEEEERRRLGRELHDQTGSNLTAMTLSLEMLRRRLPVASDDPTDLSSWFTDFEALLQDTIRHVRTVLSDLRPVALDELGLLAALRHYFSRTQSFADMTLLIDEVDPLPRLSPDVEIALFRVAQEALTNIVKHAHASTVTIGVNRDPEWLTIRIQDNGKGFYGRLGSSVTSLGMTTMKERVEGIGARWSVRSAPNQGTVVTIDLPLSEQVLAPSTARRQ
jgi:PAS domain S-box-containing protein